MLNIKNINKAIVDMTSPGTTTSFSALTLLVESFDLQKPIPDMTYNVLSGTLSPAQSIDQCPSSGSGESP